MTPQTEAAEAIRRGASPRRVLGWVVGVLHRPTPTLAEVARVRPVGWGVGVVAAQAVVTALAQPTVRAEQVLPPEAWEVLEVPPETLEGLGKLTLGLQPEHLVAAPLAAILGTLVAVAIYYATGWLFGGRAAFASLFACFCFASVPLVLLAPLRVAALALPPLTTLALYVVAGLALLAWNWLLWYVGIRETFRFGSGRALAVFLVPHLVFLGAATLFLLLLLVLVAFLMGAG